MNSYKCMLCGYVYNPIYNDDIDFNDLDENYVCPVCGAGKNEFEKEV